MSSIKNKKDLERGFEINQALKIGEILQNLETP